MFENSYARGGGKSLYSYVSLCDRACRAEEDELICCDVCGGWYHLQCMEMKEGVGCLRRKYLCAISVCQRVWSWLRDEVSLVKVS